MASPFHLPKKARKRYRRRAQNLLNYVESLKGEKPDVAAALADSAAGRIKWANAKRKKKKPKPSTNI
jgi:hypothetical protein